MSFDKVLRSIAESDKVVDPVRGEPTLGTLPLGAEL